MLASELTSSPDLISNQPSLDPVEEAPESYSSYDYNNVLQLPEELREYHQFLAEEKNKAEYAFKAWLSYVSQKYQLSPEDLITADGQILKHKA